MTVMSQSLVLCCGLSVTVLFIFLLTPLSTKFSLAIDAMMVYFFFRTHGPGGPLRPTTPLHFSLSDASWTASGSEDLHQSVMSSCRSSTKSITPTITNITIFTSHWSFILQMCSNSCNFLCFTTSTVVQ